MKKKTFFFVPFKNGSEIEFGKVKDKYHSMKKQKKCKHKWQIVPLFPEQAGIKYIATNQNQGEAGGGGGTPSAYTYIHYDAIAVCTKCLEKRYL